MMQIQEELVVIKGKCTKRSKPPSPLLEPIFPNNMMIHSPTSNDVATTKTTSSSEHELRNKTEFLEDDEGMAYCLILLAQGHDHAHKASPSPSSSKHVATTPKHDDHNDHNNNKYLFQCKTCNRCFSSFQALGGHRASHKKPNNKLSNNSFVSDLNDDHDHCDPTTTRSTILSLQLTPSSSNRPNNLYGTSNTSYTTTTTSTKSATEKSKSNSHLCSICGAEFSSGQALGGHMRRHRNFLSISTTTTTPMSGGNITNNIGGTESREAKKPRNNNILTRLDLNLPAPPEDDHHQRDQSSKFSFQSNREKVIVFSTASSLVDCHY